MSRKFIAPFMALALIALTALTAAAQAEVSNMQLSDSEGGAPRAAFPLDTETVYVGFDYQDADNTAVDVVLEGFGLIDILRIRDRYSGTGRAEVPITGAAVFQSLAANLVQQAEAAQASAKIASAASSQREYFSQVAGRVIEMNAMLDLMETVQLESEMTTSLIEMRLHVAELAKLSEEADLLEHDQHAELQAKAREMAGPAADAVRASKDVDAASDDVDNLPLPPTGDGRGEFNVQLEISLGTSGASPAAHAAFTIIEMPDAPADLKNPGGDATATAAVTQGASNDGRSTQAPPTSRSGRSANPTTPPRATAVPSGSGNTGTTGTDSGSDASDGGNSNQGAQTGSTPGATSAVTGQQQQAQGSAPGDGDGSGDTDDDGQPLSAVGEEAAGSSDGTSGDEASSPEALPTWTVPAGGQLAYGDSDTQSPEMQQAGESSESGSGGTSNRNLLLLAVGVVALIGVAIWMRGRM